ncbi:F-box/WD repeat-containing protein 5 [Bufo gargarizans]|uniref:F-box/WD repeat-containing protein 5 n=1 Tax=Bufo gargarizans TaxID=30331 RepID=UPI001CF5D864|nr:F-box/WD repeat-containing protein 5 [Bufo gargarizans]XP_044161997.1 F-box/WD repeat-containing protein 5 [Bufo gargarizans]XP_044161998.1 F-box/WD repeat-containing protein 5 [Bufo gargarizans]XP_044161999.1 F-box/WD repeat-containing protein 5 [Bufo gargarizans]
MEDAGPSLLPDSILYQIFLNLGPVDLLSAGLVCRRWYQVSRDDFLWKELFYRHYQVQRYIHRYPGSDSWYEEFQRLCDSVPCVEVERLQEHTDQVLHISFSRSGELCASCSKDCTVKIWNTRHPITLQHSANMRPHHWNYTQFSQFNSDDTLLLVSGVYVGPHNSCAGEIAVFSLDGFNLLSRVRNKPYDVFGCWLNNTHLISGNLHRMGRVTSCSVLWLNKAFQDVESENLNVVKRLFKIQNLNASTIRMIMVADSPDVLAGAGNKGEEAEQCPPQLPEKEEDSAAEDERGRDIVEEDAQITAALQFLMDDQEQQGAPQPPLTEEQFETKVAQWYAKYRTRQSDRPQAGEGSEKYLIFTTGSLTYSPHQIGIKQLLPHQMTTEGPVLGEERGPNEFFDSLDHVINIHGHIIGMGLSPDHRYLYVNSRSWPKDCVISNPMYPPPIAEEIELRVFDLKTLREVKEPLRAHRAYTPNNECFFIFLDVSQDFVASGAEDRCGYIWDRHYHACLAHLPHDDVVNSVAFCPVDQELLLSASDDYTIKVWRSRRSLRRPQNLSRPSLWSASYDT